MYLLIYRHFMSNTRAAMQFEIEELPREETICEKCPGEYEAYTSFGFIRVKPTNCILPANFRHSIDAIRNFPVREDDIFLVSNPKSGTTWSMELTWLIVNNLDYEGAKVPQEQRFPHIDVQGCVGQPYLDHMGGSVLNNITAKTSPRFIKSHLPKDLLPTEIWTKKCKVIFIVRNPKDAAVSAYHHYKLFHTYQGTLEEFLEAFLDDKVFYSPFWDQVIEFWKMRNEPNILFLNYEELKRDFEGVARKTAAFFGKTLTDEQVSTLKEYLSVGSMKKNRAVNYEGIKDFLKEKFNQQFPEGEFIREGVSGGGQNKMTPEMSKRFDEWTRRKIAGTGLEQLYG